MHEQPKHKEPSYRQLFESCPCPLWVYDLNTLRFLAVNEAAVNHYGYTREAFLKMTIKDIRPPEDISTLMDNVAKVTSGTDHAGVASAKAGSFSLRSSPNHCHSKDIRPKLFWPKTSRNA